MSIICDGFDNQKEIVFNDGYDSIAREKYSLTPEVADKAANAVIKALLDNLPEDCCRISVASYILGICQRKITEDMKIPKDWK